MSDQMFFCRACGNKLHTSATACPGCGAKQKANGSEKSLLVAVILCFLFGYLGIHRFYAGKPISGILMMFTFGFFGLWWFIDFITLLFGNFTDGSGNKITSWS